MSKRKVSFVTVLMLALGALIAACGAEATPTGDCLEPGPDGTMVAAPCEVNGETLPTPTPPPSDNGNGGDNGAATIIRNSGCGGCHTIEGVQGASGGTGPELSNVGAVAGDRTDLSAEEYIRQSLLDPDAHVVDGFSAGVMPSFEGRLSDEELDQVVEFLASLQ
ncbi:MAG: cytochrome c [Dehalococcoidia bacterium]